MRYLITLPDLITRVVAGTSRHLLHPVTKRLIYKAERHAPDCNWHLYKLRGGAWRRLSQHRTLEGAQFAARADFADHPGE